MDNFIKAFEVIHPGLCTTIQDLGRYGYQEYGVPVSGAMDDYALRIANILVGNEVREACLEITLTGLRLKVLEDSTIALTGADMGAMINNCSIVPWQAITVRTGDIISFPRVQNGCRSYLAIGGGVAVPKIMGSRSTYIKSGIGGFAGRPLRSGDYLSRYVTNSQIPAWKLSNEYIPIYSNPVEIRVLLGPQDDYFTKDGINTFLGSEYTVSIEADRVGYRLQGSKIAYKATTDIVSDGIPQGAIQVPGDGLPIVLLADRPTVGGYAKIAVVISVDIPKLAQAKPGDRVSFSATTIEQAAKLFTVYEDKISTLIRTKLTHHESSR